MKRKIAGRRAVALLTAVWLLCGLLTACEPFDSLFGEDSPTALVEEGTVFETVGSPSAAASSAYTPITSRYAYAQLGALQQELYELVLGQVYEISPEINALGNGYPLGSVKVQGVLSTAEIRVAFRAITDDNPRLFWLSHTFSHTSSVDMNCTTVYAYSQFAPAKVSGMLAEVDDAAAAFYASVPAGLDAYEREKRVHDYLLDRCEYDHEIAASSERTEQNLRAHSVYGALVDCRCVCEGYGMAMQMLLNGLGVECVTLTGKVKAEEPAEETLHLWNAVKLDGAWYHVDATWDDQEDSAVRYDYFNLDDSMMLRERTLCPTPDEIDEDAIESDGTEKLNVFIPACTDMTYHYYRYECPHLTDYGGRDVRAALYDAALQEQSTFVFYIDPDYLDYDDAVRRLFRDYPQYFFSYMQDVNDRLDAYEIDDGSIVYYRNEKRNAVAVDLTYY